MFTKKIVKSVLLFFCESSQWYCTLMYQIRVQAHQKWVMSVLIVAL